VPAHGQPGHEHALHHAAAADDQAAHHAATASAESRVEHSHDAEWEPAEGFERTAYTVLANGLTASGFALLLLAAMAGLQAWRGSVPVAPLPGLLWGIAGYLSFYLAPALGLPPEIPGAQSAALEVRQAWWLLAVSGTAGGLALLAFGRAPWRWAGLLLLLLPQLIGAPQPAGSPFAAHAPAAAVQLTVIAGQFFAATALANALYWLVLGSLAAWVFRRWLAALLPASPVFAAAR
jgi:cobalt transporter subunit CbtA